MGTDGREEHDLVLDSVLIGPIRDGRHKFVFEVIFDHIIKLALTQTSDWG